MREFKFRAWDKAEEAYWGPKGMVYFSLQYVPDFIGNTFCRKGSDHFEPRYEVMEWVGLYDKKGREIYEGDIVESVSWNQFWVDSDGKTYEALRRILVVVFHEGAFRLREDFRGLMAPTYWDLHDSGDLEVIGNIYENPDLLKPVFKLHDQGYTLPKELQKYGTRNEMTCLREDVYTRIGHAVEDWLNSDLPLAGGYRTAVADLREIIEHVKEVSKKCQT